MMGQGESPEQGVGCPASGPRCDPLLPPASVSQPVKGQVCARGAPSSLLSSLGEGELAPRRGHRRAPLSTRRELGGVHDLGYTVTTQGWPKQSARGRHPEVGFEEPSQEEGGVNDSWGPQGNAAPSPPHPLRDNRHLCIPSSEQFQNLGELARLLQHEVGQSLVVRTFSSAQIQDRKLKVNDSDIYRTSEERELCPGGNREPW